MSLSKTLTIARRELGTYFNSPVAYIVISAYLVASGALFFLQVFLIKEATMRDFFAVQPLLFIFFAPAISMRLLAEEKRSGTVAMLFTLPLGDWDVVLGKFLAALSVMGVGVLLTLAYPITIAQMGPLDWGATIAGYVGLIMMGGAYLGIGLMASSWTKNQIVAFIVAFIASFGLYLVGKLLPLMPASLGPVLRYISLDTHFANIARGVLDSRDIVYYLSIIGGCLFLAKQSLDSRRWR